MDGNLIAITYDEFASNFLDKFSTKFEATGTKKVNNFLRLEIIKLIDGSIFISQYNYIQKILP